MKKLLLILICLFVSFEVKSESDDLSGTKLLCSSKKDGDEINHVYGIDFRSDNNLVFYTLVLVTYRYVAQEPELHEKKMGYHTNLSYVMIDYNEPEWDFLINRSTLKYEVQHNFSPMSTGSCKIVENLPKILRDIQKKELKRLKKLKSKQKI